MKTLTKITASAIIMIGFSFSGFAQTNSVTGTATAELVTPITITKNNDMNFGRMSVLNAGAGTVVLTPASLRTSANVSLSLGGTAAVSANFTVHGDGVNTYALTCSTSCLVSQGAGTGNDIMTVGTITTFTTTTATTSATGSNTGALTAGSDVVKVGGTLNVLATQNAGTYASTGTNGTSFTLTVNYN